MPKLQTKFYSVHDAAKLMHISEQTLRNWTETDKVHAYVTNGGHRRYTYLDLLAAKRKMELGENAVYYSQSATISIYKTVERKGQIRLRPASYDDELEKWPILLDNGWALQKKMCKLFEEGLMAQLYVPYLFEEDAENWLQKNLAYIRVDSLSYEHGKATWETLVQQAFNELKITLK